MAIANHRITIEIGRNLSYFASDRLVKLMAPLDHGELASVLSELYTLLDTLAAIPDNVILRPPSDSGIHPADIFDADAASQAGFSDEAIVCHSLP